MESERILLITLQPGDRIAVVAPAGRVDRDALECGIEALTARGLRVRVGSHVLSTWP